MSGAVSQWDALVFLSGQLGVGLLILLQLNWYSILLGASSLGNSHLSPTQYFLVQLRVSSCAYAIRPLGHQFQTKCHCGTTDFEYCINVSHKRGYYFYIIAGKIEITVKTVITLL